MYKPKIFTKTVVCCFKQILIFAFFLSISVLVVHKLLFNNYLIGRSLDASVPPLDSLLTKAYTSNLYTWKDSINGGMRNTFSPTLIPANSLLYLPVLFGATSWFVSRYQIVISITLSMFFFFHFAKYLTFSIDSNSKHKGMIAFISSIFFTLNNLLFSEIIFGSNIMFFCSAFFPLMLLFLLRYLEDRKVIHFGIFIFSLLILSSSLQYLVLAYLFIMLTLSMKKKLGVLLRISVIHIFLSLYWLFPMLYSAPDVAVGELQGDYSASLRTATKTFSTLTNSDYFGNRHMYTQALNSKYATFVWNLSAAVLLLVCFYPLIYVINNKHLKDRYLVPVLTGILLLSIFLIKGGNSPFGSLNAIFYNHIWIFSLFRSLQRFMIVYTLVISILFVYTAVKITVKNGRTLLILGILVIINSMPWWYTRDLGRENIAKSGHPGIGLFKLAPGEDELYKLSKDSENIGVLTIPPGYSVYFEKTPFNSIYTQGGDAGISFGRGKYYFTEGSAGYLSPLLNALEKDMYTNPDFINNNKYVLSILNIKFLVIRKNVKPVFSENARMFTYENVYRSLDSSSIISKVTDYPTITIIEIESDHVLPHLYVPNQCQIFAGNIKGIKNYMNSVVKQKQFVVYLKDQLPGNTSFADTCPPRTQQSPKVNFTKLNPTKYKVELHKASGITPLVFLESFSSGWKLEVVGNKSKGQTYPIDEAQHMVANGYANSWLIDTNKICGTGSFCTKNPDGTYNIELTVEFWPQKLFYIGAGISIITALICIIYLSYCTISENRKRKA